MYNRHSVSQTPLPSPDSHSRVVRVDPGARDGATLAPARPRPCSIQTSHCVAYPRVFH